MLEYRTERQNDYWPIIRAGVPLHICIHGVNLLCRACSSPYDLRVTVVDKVLTTEVFPTRVPAGVTKLSQRAGRVPKMEHLPF